MAELNPAKPPAAPGACSPPTAGLRAPSNTPSQSLDQNVVDVPAVSLDHDDNAAYERDENLMTSVAKKLEGIALAEDEKAEQQVVEDLYELHKDFLQVQKEYFAERKRLEKKFRDKLNESVFAKRAEASAKIEHFWTVVISTNIAFEPLVTEDDMEPLQFLRDIKCVEVEDTATELPDQLELHLVPDEEMEAARYGFRVEFHFLPNPFFENEVLYREFCVPNLYSSQYPVLASTKGCNIRWKSEENLAANGNETFFNFFCPAYFTEPKKEENEEEEDDDLYDPATDFRRGFELFEKIVPEAIRWFTGEATQDAENYYPSDDMGADDEEEDEEEEEEEDDDDEDEDNINAILGSRRGNRSRQGPRLTNNSSNQQQCKQQ